ncbi:MAG: hypothetical protein NZ954_05020 [Thermofilaceae archaeon]|nr:hypothetical protein [Thermofilaceae archaeon]MCX8180168.1 hypothetical protein [Thermofilaceae archaeon]MDW8004176.1 hypothetical protein [Thermofilaceae archaeon]
MMASNERLEGTMKGSYVEVTPNKELLERGYGSQRGDVLELSLIEATYLLYKGELQVKDEEGRILGFEELTRLAAALDPVFWIKLLVYSDLRSRGLRVKPIEGSPVMIAERKVKEGERKYMVLCVEEGVRVGFRDLEMYIRRALESKRDLVLAIIDKEGNVSYYRVEKSMG